MNIFTKESLTKSLMEISKMGWIENARPGNDGGVGNTLEDLLGITENNLPLPNAAEWELKCQRLNTSSLTTLFHMEPSPRALRFVPSIFLLSYGWPHQQAGSKYPDNEMSFRQTINGLNRTDRGFGLVLDRAQGKLNISFDHTSVSPRHAQWLNTVRSRIGLSELNPQPYWGLEDLVHKIGSKLHNCFFVQADVKKENGKEYFHYCKAAILRGISINSFATAIQQGYVLVDFDARTGHNHGTKFRLRQEKFDLLYKEVNIIFDHKK